MLKNIVVAITLCSVLAGCQKNVAPEPFSSKVKIGDLASVQHKANPDNIAKVVPVFCSVYVLSLPEENLSVLGGIWRDIPDKAIRFKDAGLFKENFLGAGMGKSSQWDPIAKRLESAGANHDHTSILTIVDDGTGQKNEVSVQVAQLSDETTIFYKTDQGQPYGATIGPGKITLKIRARVLPGARGVASVRIVPAFEPYAAMRNTSLLEPENQELIFEPAQFGVSMEPGDFVLLGPLSFIPQEQTLNTKLFSKPQARGTVQIFLIVCTKVGD